MRLGPVQDIIRDQRKDPDHKSDYNTGNGATGNVTRSQKDARALIALCCQLLRRKPSVFVFALEMPINQEADHPANKDRRR